MSYNDEAVQEAVGSTFLGWEWTREALTLRTSAGTFVGRVNSGCCSEAWIESAEETTVGSLFPVTVTELDVGGETRDGREVDVGPSDYDNWMESCFGTVRLSTGRITYELRCKSNGFYSGWLDWTKVAE